MTESTTSGYDQERWDRRQQLLLRALANQLYQQARQTRLEYLEKGVKAASLILGTAAFVKLFGDVGVSFAAAGVVAASIVSLVLGWGERARDAAKRTAEWASFKADVEAKGHYDFSDQDLDLWTARVNRLEVGEPRRNEHLWARTYTKACELLRLEPLKPFTKSQLEKRAIIIP